MKAPTDPHDHVPNDYGHCEVCGESMADLYLVRAEAAEAEVARLRGSCIQCRGTGAVTIWGNGSFTTRVQHPCGLCDGPSDAMRATSAQPKEDDRG